MNRSRSIMAGAALGLALSTAGFVSIPTQGNAGVATMTAAERVSNAFALLAATNPDSAASSAIRTVSIGYQTDATAVLLLRKPGAPEIVR